MGKFIFEGNSLHIHIDESAVVNGAVSFTVEELWTEYLIWFAQGDNSKYPPALRLTGGDPIGGGQNIGNYVFLRNDLGWRGKPPLLDGVAVVIDGAFYAEDSTLPIFENNPNQETDIIINRSSMVTAVETGTSGSSSGITMSELQSEMKKLANLILAVS